MGPNKDLEVKSTMIAGTSISTLAAELRYEVASTSIDLLTKDEELRKVRLRNKLLGHELDGLNEKLCEEFDRGDNAELDAQDWKSRAEDLTERMERMMNDLRSRTREMEILKAELSSLQDVSADSTKLLTEKLALTRELAHLKPEIEHYRSQANTNQGVLAEKLSLQRQLNTTQAELENATRTIQRLSARESKSGEQTIQYEAQVEELKKELSKEQKERQKVERTTTRISEKEVEELKKELVKEKRDRQKAENAARQASEEQLEDLRTQLVKEKREREKTDSTTSKARDEKLEELKIDLAKEKRERQNAEKEANKADAEWKSQKAVLDDKLDQFRTKLRSTKEKLKSVELELVKVQAAAVVRPSVAATKAKNPRKRAAVHMDPDAAIGTPGDAIAAKRGKRASSVVGEKSTFSITPFLNRTTSVALDSPPKEQDEVEQEDVDEPVASIENPTSPSLVRSIATLTTKKPKSVLEASTNKGNKKSVPEARKKAAVSTGLEIVAEEGEAAEDAENNPPVPTVAGTATILTKVIKPALKPKSLNSFASFRDTSLPPQPQQKKKQKLFGGVGKTIFDEDEDGDEGAFATGKIGFGGQRSFGAFGVRGFGGVSLLQPKTKGPLVVAPDGFMFSPLKKDRKAMAAAAAAVR